MVPDLVGWTASAMLIVTLARQTHTQAQQADIQGALRWLFSQMVFWHQQPTGKPKRT